ncbi:tetratricopeptide repeat protein [bacterium]|nr:tetratricopeptide repeat protein [bacterium]MBU1652823.1 tetratricopeptide repeat protein [bacterium]
MLQWFKKKTPKRSATPSSQQDVVDERALELVALGDKMYTAEDYQGAFEAYDSALRVDGHCPDAWYRRGRYFMRDGNTLKAAACFARALELNPKLDEAWCGLGETILNFIKEDSEPLLIREHRVEIVSEAQESFSKSLRLGGNSPRAKEGRELARSMLQQEEVKLAKPPFFSFQSGGLLETAKREVVTPFLKPGDYRRKTLPANQDD